MRSPLRTLATALGAVGVAALIATGCASSDSESDNDGGPTSDVKAGLVTDTGGLNDRSFNQLANKGLMKAEKDLGVTTSVLESKASSDYDANLGKFASQGYDLSIGVGYLMGDSIKSVASKKPDVKFAVIDFSYDPPLDNVRGLVFMEQEAGYLAGVAAGLFEMSESRGLNPRKVVSSVGGQKIPPVDKYIAGFEAGVKSVCKDCTTLHTYSNDFTAQDKCKEAALTQIAKGSDIVFQVAGGCGLGALDAAKEKGVWGIGVDADQAYLGKHILTSALKRVDVAVFDTIESITKDEFEAGTGVYGLKEDGVGLGEMAPELEQYKDEIDAVIADIKAGKIKIPTEVK